MEQQASSGDGRVNLKDLNVCFVNLINLNLIIDK